ncbi:MAG: vWA domain-containing protein, partial [Anaerolineales bacterium]
VLAIDTSDSMANAANPVLGESPDPAVCNVVTTTPPDPQGFTGNCHPFLEVKKAAYSFIQRLKEPYDRLAVVTYDLSPQVVVPLTNTMTLDQIGNIVKTLNVSPRHSPGDGACTYPPDPSGCVNTSIGGGLQIGAGEFGRQPIRQEAVWVVILLTDGAANASVPIPGNLNPACPNTTWVQPFCRDASAATRHAITDTINAVPTVGTVLPNGAVYDPGQYDADDFARDMADFAACASRVAEAAPWCRVSLDYASGQGGQGAVVFGIGLGPLVINFCCGDRDAGDRLLRYIAAVGDDGNAETDPCLGATVPVLTTGNDSYNCGNYFFSEFGSGLSDVFGSIASRIFTRLTH